jgi:hypothetical protein
MLSIPSGLCRVCGTPVVRVRQRGPYRLFKTRHAVVSVGDHLAVLADGLHTEPVTTTEVSS